jgi:hypothetical protein
MNLGSTVSSLINNGIQGFNGSGNTGVGNSDPCNIDEINISNINQSYDKLVQRFPYTTLDNLIKH